MSTIGKRTIFVGPADDANHKPLTFEGIAGGAIRPGALLVVVSNALLENGEASTVFGTQVLLADKDELRTRSVDDSLVSGDQVQAFRPRSGEFFNVLVASGQTPEQGLALTSNGDGTLKAAATDGTDVIVAYCDEKVPTLAENTLIRVYFA